MIWACWRVDNATEEDFADAGFTHAEAVERVYAALVYTIITLALRCGSGVSVVLTFWKRRIGLVCLGIFVGLVFGYEF